MLPSPFAVALTLNGMYGVAPCSYFYDFAAPGKYNYIRIALGRPKDQIMKATKLMNLFAKGFTDC